MPIIRRGLFRFIYRLQGRHLQNFHPHHERIRRKKYDKGDDIKMIIKNLKMPTLENLKALDSMADNVDKKIYREDVKSYTKDSHALTRSAKKL